MPVLASYFPAAYFPAGHLVHEAEPTEEDSPVEQAEQFVELVTLLNRPAGQIPQAEPPTPRR